MHINQGLNRDLVWQWVQKLKFKRKIRPVHIAETKLNWNGLTDWEFTVVNMTWTSSVLWRCERPIKSPSLSAATTAALRSFTAEVTAFISSTADMRDFVALRWSPPGEGRGDMVPAATDGDGITGWILAFEAISPSYLPSNSTGTVAPTKARLI